MFLGHFGLAMAAKKVAPRVSLGTTFLAAQFLDALWPLFVLIILGIVIFLASSNARDRIGTIATSP